MSDISWFLRTLNIEVTEVVQAILVDAFKKDSGNSRIFGVS